MRKNTTAKTNTPREVKSRSLTPRVENELWGRAAGRCELDGCNKPLFISPLTQEPVNISEKAHIWSFAEHGPRGRGPYAKDQALINEHDNLLLACSDCHKLIDKEKDGGRYTAAVLQASKRKHEQRIAINTGVTEEKRSHVVIYAASISDQTSKIRFDDARSALFPNWYPSAERPTHLSMSWEGRDHDKGYWETEATNLRTKFERQVRPLLEDGATSHFSVFAHAPIPLLVLLGTLFTDKPSLQTYQLHREPEQTWRWLEGPADFSFHLRSPNDVSGPPALILSLSDVVRHDRVTSVAGPDTSIWELTIDEPHNDFLKSKLQLSRYREAIRKAMVKIGEVHGHSTPLKIFPAIPLSCAIELGRARMPKAQMPWVLYDQSNVHGKFIETLNIF